MGSVPDRWFNYSSIGQVVPGTPFIACKTPLKLSIESRIRFTPENLIESVKALGKNLVLVIDLTFTSRYYNKDEFQNIPHVKIFTRGRAVPTPDIVSRFFEAVDSCIQNLGKDDIIAVHCTHGVNRTGYFICKYMIDKLNFDPQKAIEEFNTARGHRIERENYLSSLKGETIEGTDSVYSNKPQEEMTKPYPRQQWRHPPNPSPSSQNHQWSRHNQNPRPSSQNHQWSRYDQNPRPSPQNYQEFYHRNGYQDHRRDFQPSDSYHYENQPFSSLNDSHHYFQGPNPQQVYQNYHYDDHYNRSSNHFESHWSSSSSPASNADRKRVHGNSSQQSSYRNHRRDKRDRWRGNDY